MGDVHPGSNDPSSAFSPAPATADLSSSAAYLTSPDGTRYTLVVADDGTLSAEPADAGDPAPGLSIEPDSGPLHSNTDVVVHGTDFNPAWTYGVSLYDNDGVTGGISSSWTFTSATPNTTTEVYGTMLSGDITEMASAPGPHEVRLRVNDGSGWQYIDPPLTFTYT